MADMIELWQKLFVYFNLSTLIVNPEPGNIKTS